MSAVAALGSASTSRVVLPFGAFVRHKLASCHAGLQDAFMKYPEILPVMLMAVAGLAAAGPSPRLTRQRKENYNALQERNVRLMMELAWRQEQRRKVRAGERIQGF
eukprot:gnl/Hemi2/24360_TR8184_c0_g2_i1.p3 gnl/Hemi2/24360_TR8184_c0_g2~~gnl/Hemi2/24360_TR8184_c0_g2_i1.p3  ORF type:complete len:106 (+),score=40.46 gnl/Hemi2/24360_TR8184_c0_g2_i1:60-377(+)